MLKTIIGVLVGVTVGGLTAYAVNSRMLNFGDKYDAQGNLTKAGPFLGFIPESAGLGFDDISKGGVIFGAGATAAWGARKVVGMFTK